MEKLTLKQYAVKHKMSLFSVVKLVKSGELRSETVKEGEREILYIPVGEPETEQSHQEGRPSSLQDEEKRVIEERVAALEAEVKTLRQEIRELKQGASYTA